MNYMTWGLCVSILLLSGCERLGLTPEAKINGAMPVSQQLLIAKSDMAAQLDDKRKKTIEQEFEARLKVRALSCAKGYTPSWFTSGEEIRKHLSDRNCFAASDNETVTWLGLVRAGILLDMPALVALPAEAPKFIVADRNIQSASFAEAAGVALLDVSPGIQVVDISNGKKLFELEVSYRPSNALSANGRMLVTNENGKLRFYSVESGEMVAEVTASSGSRFDWLAHDTGIFSGKENKAMVVDFVAGKIMPIPGVPEWTNRVIPAGEDHFLLANYRSVSKIRVTRTPEGAEALLVDEVRVDGLNANPGTSGLLSDASRFFYVNRDLFLVSVNNLRQEKTSFAPFMISSVTAMPDADKVVVTGYGPTLDGSKQGIYQYSLKQQTLYPVENGQLVSQRFVYIPSLKKLGLYSQSKIALLDELPIGKPILLSELVTEASEAESLRKIEQFERMQLASRGVIPGYGGGVYASEAAEAPAPSADGAPGYAGSARSAGLSASLAGIAKDAQVEGVGVYQGTLPHNVASVVQVRVKKTASPLILSLSSYESVKWVVIPDPGAKINAILLSGYEQSQVIGTYASKVVQMGSAFAYERGSGDFAKLDNQIYSLTGKRLSRFQGRYEGKEFVVGNTY